jgi:hypothetical protein
MTDRKTVLDILAARMPLAYTVGLRALDAWMKTCSTGTLSLQSATGRKVSLYLGPARRFFGDPDATLKHRRGRVAIVIDRSVIQRDWMFSPWDVGEVLYHWRYGRIMNEYLTVAALQGNPKWEFTADQLQDFFRTFLDEAYEDPMQYLDGWVAPRPSIVFSTLQNTIYRAASDRWFGRVRGFTPAWTFEVRADAPVAIPTAMIIGIVLIEDECTNALVDACRAAFGSRYYGHPVPSDLLHPDLPPLILESATRGIIRRWLETQMPPVGGTSISD